MTPRDLALGGFGALAAVLVAVIALEVTAAPAPPAQDAAPARQADLPAAVVDDVPALVPVILARPLFATDRRPKADAAAVGPLSDQMPRLAGILIDRAQRRAIFQPDGDAKPLTLAEGDQIAGWQIQRIAADGVTIAGPKGTQTLQPKADPALAAANASPAANPPGPNPRQFLPGGMPVPPGVPNPFAGQPRPAPGRPVVPQPQVRQQGGAPVAPNRR